MNRRRTTQSPLSNDEHVALPRSSAVRELTSSYKVPDGRLLLLTAKKRDVADVAVAADDDGVIDRDGVGRLRVCAHWPLVIRARGARDGEVAWVAGRGEAAAG
jgi:hypothetical protein